MGAESEVALRLALKNRHETVVGLDDVGDELNRVGDQADRAGRKARLGAVGMLSFGKAGRVAGRAAVYGVGAATAGVVGAGIVLAKLSKDSIGEAREAQKVGAITRREIKATGGVANISARQVGRLTSAISRKVGIDDEAIQSGANLLLTFKNVHNEVGRGNDIFGQATRAAVDLSAGGYGSIESASKMLGKALNDPLKGITALSKGGVTFSEQQTDQITNLVEQNDLLDAQKIILGEVQSQVGGVARAQATWGDKAKVSIGNIEEGLGTAVLPLLDRAEKWFVQKGTPVLEDWVGVFEKRGVPAIEHGVDVFQKKAVPAIGDFLDEARPLAKSILPAIGTGLSTAADAFKVIAPKAKAVFDGFNNLPDWAKSAIAISLGASVAAKKLGAGSLLSPSGIAGAVTKSKPLPVWVVNSGVNVPGTPGGKVSKFGKYAPFSVLGAGGEIGAGVLLFTAGAAALAYLQHEQRGDNKDWMTSPGHNGIRPAGGPFKPDAYGTAIQSGIISGKTAGDKLGAAAGEKDWLKVIHLAQQYRGALNDSTYAQSVAQHDESGVRAEVRRQPRGPRPHPRRPDPEEPGRGEGGHRPRRGRAAAVHPLDPRGEGRQRRAHPPARDHREGLARPDRARRLRHGHGPTRLLLQQARQHPRPGVGRHGAPAPRHRRPGEGRTSLHRRRARPRSHGSQGQRPHPPQDPRHAQGRDRGLGRPRRTHDRGAVGAGWEGHRREHDRAHPLHGSPSVTDPAAVDPGHGARHRAEHLLVDALIAAGDAVSPDELDRDALHLALSDLGNVVVATRDDRGCVHAERHAPHIRLAQPTGLAG